MVKANLIKVKVYPKNFKAIPDVLPFNKLLQGDPVELELDKKEILRCMNFGDVYDMTSGEEVLIDEVAFKAIEEFIDDEASEEEAVVDNSTSEQIEENTEKGAVPAHVEETPVTDDPVMGKITQ